MAKTRKQPKADSDNHPSEHRPLTGGPGNGFISEDERRLAEQLRTVRERQKQALNLQRVNILSQTTSQPARRAALEAALTQIEGQIQAMG
jgi:hypothetical protein